ncbi:hypothetical protein ACFVUY_40155 [Kitasatospora sp. NPDC058063]|uniref:hypothetical protein n=1 Tax=unclassified Kitasatospora TaxID=2633591 RepID=UPI0036D9ABA7
MPPRLPGFRWARRSLPTSNRPPQSRSGGWSGGRPPRRRWSRVIVTEPSQPTAGPQDKAHSVRIPRHSWEEAPSGMLSRGSYTAKSTFVDDDGKTLGEVEYAYDITPNWPAAE